jgi:uncharacterized membrane protein
MAWISSTTVIYLHSCLLFTVAFYLVKDPSQFVDSTFLLVFGEAMRLDHGQLSGSDSVKSLIVVILGLLGITDIVQLIQDNKVYFESIIPVRLTLAFGFAGYGYAVETSVFHEDTVFVFLFMEIWFHFVIYNVVRQEKHERNKRYEQKLEQELLEIQQDDEKFEKIISKVERTSDI